MATNEVGTTEAPFHLNLQKLAPMFKSKLESALEVSEGKPIVLECMVDGSPMPAVQWFKDSEELIPDAQ